MNKEELRDVLNEVLANGKVKDSDIEYIDTVYRESLQTQTNEGELKQALELAVKKQMNEAQAKESVTDEEIEKYCNDQPYYGTCTHEWIEGIEQGAKWMRDKLQAQTQQTISNEEIEKKINFLNSKDLPTVWKLKELSKWMQDNLQAQTNEGELIEDIENILYKHIKSICKINSIIDDITQFRNHQNTNKDE